MRVGAVERRQTLGHRRSPDVEALLRQALRNFDNELVELERKLVEWQRTLESRRKP